MQAQITACYQNITSYPGLFSNLPPTLHLCFSAIQPYLLSPISVLVYNLSDVSIFSISSVVHFSLSCLLPLFSKNHIMSPSQSVVMFLLLCHILTVDETIKQNPVSIRKSNNVFQNSISFPPAEISSTSQFFFSFSHSVQRFFTYDALENSSRICCCDKPHTSSVKRRVRFALRVILNVCRPVCRHSGYLLYNLRMKSETQLFLIHYKSHKKGIFTVSGYAPCLLLPPACIQYSK